MSPNSRFFPGTGDSIAQARAWTRRVLAETSCDAQAVDNAELIISELATNAVRYSVSGQSGGSYRVGVTVGVGQVHLEVADQGGTTSTPQVGDLGQNDEDVHGRGLWMIQRLARRLGIVGDHQGRLVFADIPAHPGDDAETDAGTGGGCRVLHSDEEGVWPALLPALEAILGPGYDLESELRAFLEEIVSEPEPPPRRPRPG